MVCSLPRSTKKGEMMDKYYILKDQKIVAVDLTTWAKWLEKNNANRHVKDEKIGDVRVSTVFLGLDHQWGDGPPLLFETLVFEGELDGDMERYSTWDEAEVGHAEMVERVKSHQNH